MSSSDAYQWPDAQPPELEKIIVLTGELIRFKTTASRQSEIRLCFDFIKAYLAENRIDFLEKSYNDVSSVLILPQENFAKVLLLCHIDVVDAPDELFKPRIEDNRLYGRGSIDDKYAVALSLLLFKSYLDQAVRRGQTQKDLPFGILITSDEETGGYNGTRKILETLKTDFCITLDGGSIDKIVLKEKGLIKLKLISEGKAAHGSRPWLGENAIEKLMADYATIRLKFQESAPGHWHRTVNIGMFRAGNAVNQVPDRAEALLDIRYTENDNPRELIEDIQKSISSKVVVEKCEPLFWGGSSPYLDLLLEISNAIRIGREHGASDARFLMEHDIAGIVWGADGDLSQHSLNEHVNIDSLAVLYKRLDLFMGKIGSGFK